MSDSHLFVEGQIYSRKELALRFKIIDQTLQTGIFQPKGMQSIWLFVTEKKESHLPQLHDMYHDGILEWSGQQEGRKDDLIISHEKEGLELLVFYRRDKSEFTNYGFQYIGSFKYVSHTGNKPTQFILIKDDNILHKIEVDLQSLWIEEGRLEGKSYQTTVNRFERDLKIRTASIRIHGLCCQGCGFSFKDTYGEWGENYIEVHHKYPLSGNIGEVVTDPKNDMAVLCSNCHRMIHRRADQLLSIDELRSLISEQRNRMA